MEKITVETLQDNLPSILSRVLDDQEPVTVSTKLGKKVVIMDSENYSSLLETLHLLRSPANAERLMEGIRQHREGGKREIDVKAYLD